MNLLKFERNYNIDRDQVNGQQFMKCFTLTELLIVLVIIGLLMVIALPNLMPLISKTHSVEAQQALTTIEKLQKTYRMVNMKYTSDLQKIGYERQPTLESGGKAKYEIRVLEAGLEHFVVEALAVVDFDGDGNYNLWRIDQSGDLVEVVPD